MAALALVLLLQFLLGMAVNLFVDITRHHPGTNSADYFAGLLAVIPWGIASGPLLLKVHVLLGLLIVFVAWAFFIWSLLRRVRGVRIALGVGAFAALAAGFNGGSFLIYNEDFSSMFMAAGFALTLGAYILALGWERPTRAQLESDAPRAEP